jgi:hypothetical protein
MENSPPSCSCLHRVPRRIHRLSGSLVFLGHALLVPALLVTIFGSMGVVGFRSAPSDEGTVLTNSALLGDAGVPARVIAEVSSHQPLTPAELESLSSEQRRRVLEAQLATARQGARASMTSFTSSPTFRLLVAIAATCAAGGCFLLRKRTVACCANCGAIHAPAEAHATS